MTNTINMFCEHLVRECPSLTDTLDEHIRDNDELIPYLFLADVTRYVLAGKPGRPQIVGFLEDAFKQEGEPVENLIAASFIENIETKQELDQILLGTSSPSLREGWMRQHPWNG